MTLESNLVTVEWLAGRIGDASVVIADCRFDLNAPRAGRAEYEVAHIPGAVYFDLDADLSAPRRAHGGRHPLPDIAVLGRKLGDAGIDERMTVVAYDAQHGCMAARLWWMLRYLGHSQAKVLDGGWQAWRRGGHPAAVDVAPVVRRVFRPRVRPELLVGLDQLRRRLGDTALRLVDSRAAERYRGDVEPLDPVAGHIPGAINLPWTDNLDSRGILRPVEALRKRFAPLQEGAGRGEAVVYCGSGVTACVNLLALEEAGITGAVLYLGGWSDWCSYRDNPVAAGARGCASPAPGSRGDG